MEVPSISGDVFDVPLEALEQAEADLITILREQGKMTIRFLGQRYMADHGVSFKDEVGLTLACFLHSEYGTAFVVKEDCLQDGKGKVRPFKDVVTVRPDAMPVAACCEEEDEEASPHAFPEEYDLPMFAPLCGAVEESGAEEAFEASPHAFPEEYDLPEYDSLHAPAMPMVMMQPQQLLATNAQPVQGFFPAQQGAMMQVPMVAMQPQQLLAANAQPVQVFTWCRSSSAPAVMQTQMQGC